MTEFKENCIYNNFKTGITSYIVLNFITLNFYHFYYMFKVANLFKYVDSLKSKHRNMKICAIFLLVSVLVTIGYAVYSVWIILNNPYGLFGYLALTDLKSVAIISTTLIILSFLASFYWAFAARSCIRMYNIETYGIDYTANIFFTLFCPGIVFIWAIENTPVEARLRKLKRAL